MVGVGLARSAATQVKEQPSEVVELKSLTASVQETIKAESSGRRGRSGKKEDDANGKCGIMMSSSERPEKSRASTSIQTANS
jgi:hypothetical protein